MSRPGPPAGGQTRARSPAPEALFVLGLWPLGRGGDPSAIRPEDRERFDAAWKGLLSYLDVEHPDIDLGLRPGAGDEEITRFEAFVGRGIPGEIRELYRRADGQDRQGFSVFPGYRFAPLEDAKAQWKIQRHPMIRLLGLIPAGDNDPEVRNRGWHPGWIPIGENGAGDMICADLVPADGGTRGQLIEFIHDDTCRRRIAPGITEYLERLRRGLGEGSVVAYHEWKTFLPKEDVPRPSP